MQRDILLEAIYCLSAIFIDKSSFFKFHGTKQVSTKPCWTKGFNIILNFWLMQELLANAMNKHCLLFERFCFGRWWKNVG